MFCPNCGVEYRPGFTRCNDSDVDRIAGRVAGIRQGEAIRKHATRVAK